ncbi:hypothetical protein BBJ28_00021984 [Nothophytophthora sp. Chile5]|nr:hypothetical protein BBJ28_00021984 [Nothophytophthora sp. Chile5]
MTSMDLLREVEQQLSHAVTSVHLHLQTHNAAPDAATGPVLSTAESHALLGRIERLQNELLASTTAIVTQAKLQLQNAATQSSAEAEGVDPAAGAGSETETEDEDAHLESAGQKREREREESREQQQRPAKRGLTNAGRMNAMLLDARGLLHLGMLRFLEATKEALEVVHRNKTPKQVTHHVTNALGNCRSTASKLLSALQAANPVDEETAALFLNAVILLAEIIATECVQGLVPRKHLTKAITCFEQVLDFVDKKEDVPMALLDPLLRSSHLKLKTYFQEHFSDSLDELQLFVRTTQARKGVLDARIRGPLGELLPNFQRECRSFGHNERCGVTKHSEERWTLFANIATVLADWIGIVLQSTKPPTCKLRKTQNFAKHLKEFAEQFPGRVPPLLIVHLLTCAYTAGYAKFYWDFDATWLSYSLENYAVGMPREHFRTIAWVYVAMAAAHGVCVLLMLLGSLWRRTLVFTPWTDIDGGRQGQGSTTLAQTAGTKNTHDTERPKGRVTTARILQSFGKTYTKLADRRGVFGVNGRYFHAILICRELVETVLQTIQAVRMSKFLPRAVLNRFYVSLLVINCWSSVVIYSRLFHRDEARRRFACLVCDCVLILMSVVGVSVLIVLSYVNQYDVELSGFDFSKWDDDNWVAQTLNEARIVLVVSCYHDYGLRSRVNRVLLYIVHLSFGAWGLLVLAMHVEASIHTPLAQCKPRVNPMAGSLPSCYLADFNCNRMEISAALEEMMAEFRKFDRSTVLKLNILHCSALELPASFQELSHLRQITLYNSTISDWGASAATTNTHHPDTTTLYIVRVNMTDGLLPLGLQSLDFPLNLLDIEFCVTNLRTLPEDLHSKWIAVSNLYIEMSQLTSVSPSLIHLQPYVLALADNPITALPLELFAAGGIQYLGLGGTNVNELPRNVTELTLGPAFITLAETNISSFWGWIDPLVEDMLDIPPALLAGGSPYCPDREQIMSGISDTFSVPFNPEYSEILMNASESNWDVLRQAVDCLLDARKISSPLDLWDALYALV